MISKQKMSVKRNIIANYIGQLYVALIGIFLVPLYVEYMGAEAYGLIGFYAMLQAWFFMLDVGLTPTMAREAARFRGGEGDALNLRKFLRALEGIFAFIALVGATIMALSTNIVANQWLRINELSMQEVHYSLVLIALVISLRWMGGLYKSAINGFEYLVWLNTFNVVISTFRFVFVVPVLAYIDAAPTTFFGYQLAVTIFETCLLYSKTYKLMPPVRIPIINWSWTPLRDSLKFSLTIAFVGVAWIVVTQTDKLLLSGLLPLADYGYFTLAVLAASGIMILSRPVSGAVLPRLTRLNAEHKEEMLIQLYRDATQIVAVISIPSMLLLSLFPEQVLMAWTGDSIMVQKSYLLLSLYSLGNGVMIFAAFPYYIQYAKGELKLHLIGNGLFLVVFVPSIYFLVTRYGAIGAGYAWIATNVLFFLLYVPLVHKKFIKGMHMKWLTADVIFIGIPPLIFLLIVGHLIHWPTNQFALVIYLIGVYAGSIATAAASSSKVRLTLYSMIKTKLFIR